MAIDRKAFLTLGLGACCAAGLTACGMGGDKDKGSYDDGYAAGYAAGLADAAKDAESEQGGSSASSSYKVEYTINSASLGVAKFTGESLIILDMSGKNVSGADQWISFNRSAISVYQNGVELNSWSTVEGRESSDSRTVQDGVSLDGWIAFELLDSTTPVECKQISSITNLRLTNPQTIDITAL